MAFTDEQFDRLLSPMYRSMRQSGQQRSLLNGLLSAQEPPAGSVSGALEGGGAAAYQGQSPLPQSTPSRSQLLMQPAQTLYAKSTPPAQSQANIWTAPSGSNLRYPDSVPPTGSVTAGLLDGPSNSVAAGLDATPMTMPTPQTPQLDLNSLTAPPPPEADILFPQGNALAVRPPEYLQAVQYAPLAPSRRYEVL